MKRVKIIFVCTGNTCRSPIAEYLLKDQLKQRSLKGATVSSAGLVVRESKLTDNTVAVLREMNVNVSKSFKPKQFDVQAVKSNTIIVCMTDKHKHLIAEKNVYCAKELIGFDISDPFGGDIEAYRKTANELTWLVNAVVDKFILPLTY